jgi:hypothetical protein
VRARAKAGRNGHGVLMRFLNEDVHGGPQDDHCDYKMVSREATAEWADRRPVFLVVKTLNSAKGRSQ